MTSGDVAGVLLAALAAGLFAVGTVAQQHVVAEQVREHDRLGVGRLLLSRDWLLGQGATVLAALLQVAALAVAPVGLVQPLLASGLVVALGLRLRRERRWPRAVETAGALAALVGLAVFLVAARPAAGPQAVPGGLLTVLVVAGCAALVGLAVLLPRGRAGAVGGGAVAGLVLGVAAVVTAGGLVSLRADGWGCLAGPAPWAALLTGVLGEVASQQAFGRGALAWSLPALTVVDPVAAVPVARLLLHEHLAAGSTVVWAPAAALAVAGVVLLAIGPDVA